MYRIRNLTIVLALLILATATCKTLADKHETRQLSRVFSRLSSQNGPSGGAKFSRVKYLTLAIAWLPGVCFINFSQCSSRQKTVDFTIHGLWAQAETELKNCPPIESLSYSSIKPFVRELEASWKSYKDMPAETLWRYQYTAHGTCMASIDQVNSPTKYLRSTLRLFQQLNLKRVLAQNNIVPDNRIAQSGQMVVNVIENYLGVQVRMTCQPSESHPNIYLLQEVRICYGINLEPIDCPYGTSSKCRGSIIYAKY